jgi:hypothetical protein
VASAIARTRWYAAAFGAAGLIAMVLFFGGHDLGLGPGGMERVTAYSVPAWTLITGSSCSARSHQTGSNQVLPYLGDLVGVQRDLRRGHHGLLDDAAQMQRGLEGTECG